VVVVAVRERAHGQLVHRQFLVNPLDRPDAHGTTLRNNEPHRHLLVVGVDDPDAGVQLRGVDDRLDLGAVRAGRRGDGHVGRSVGSGLNVGVHELQQLELQHDGEAVLQHGDQVAAPVEDIRGLALFGLVDTVSAGAPEGHESRVEGAGCVVRQRRAEGRIQNAARYLW